MILEPEAPFTDKLTPKLKREEKASEDRLEPVHPVWVWG